MAELAHAHKKTRTRCTHELPFCTFPILCPRSAQSADRRPAGEGANIDRRLVSYTRDAMRTKSRIEFIYLYIYIFIYLYIYIYASTVVLMRAALEFWPW